jgi:hypothetical protein
MASCNLRGSCFFYNELIPDMPHATEYLKDEFCKGRFTECAIYTISKVYGEDKAPKYLYPNDTYEVMNFNLFEPQGGLDMFLKVIYPDGKVDMAKSSEIGGMIKAGRIVAFHCSEGWVEARRKRNKEDYFGPERRKSNVPIFESP